MRFQFQSEHGQFSWRPKYFTDAIKILIGMNTLLFLFKIISKNEVDMVGLLGLSTQTVWPLIWQPITYMFIHGDIWHVGINMFVLFLFGSELESLWGRYEFIKYYIITGLGSGLVWLLFQFFSSKSFSLIGASGAVYGILTAYGLIFPNRIVYIYFLIPVKVKFFVLILGVISFFSSIGNNSNISHLAHLSGMFIGYAYLRLNTHWKKLFFKIKKRLLETKLKKEEVRLKKKKNLQKDIDKILDKINIGGFSSLTEKEINKLYSASKEFSKEKNKD